MTRQSIMAAKPYGQNAAKTVLGGLWRCVLALIGWAGDSRENARLTSRNAPVQETRASWSRLSESNRRPNHYE